jgi:signal transduction histidine kinase
MRYSSIRKEPSVSGGSPEPLAQGQAVDFIEPVILEQRQGNEDELYFGRTSVKTKKTAIGQVKVSLDGSVVAEAAKSIVVRSIMIGCLFLLLGTAFLAIILQRVLLPLSQLTEEVKMLGEGKSIEKISVESEDEIGRLAAAFNEMAENLKRREEEKVKLEQQLRHAQKMEAVGTLARGIAHDFNNILTTVQASIYIMQKKIDKTDSIYTYVIRLNNSISRAKMLVQSLLTFSRGQTVKLFPIELNSIILNMEPMIRAIMGDGIECSITVPEAPLVAMADSTQMEQVLLNLAANARDAMADGGTLTVTMERVVVEAGERITRPGAYSLIMVVDTGGGIPDEIKERIFEPFFTTKEVGKGTGLGLSIVYGIIEQHQGYIFVDPGPGKGAAFSIYLPLFEKNGHLRRDAGRGETHG